MRRHNHFSLYVPATSQVRLKWNTQRCLSRTSPNRLSGTSPRDSVVTTYVTTSPWDKMTVSHQYVSTTSQTSLKWNTQLETPKDVSVVRHQDVSVVRIYDVPLVTLYEVSCTSQMKHPITSLWYISTTFRSYVITTPCLYCGLSYVFKLLCHELHLVGLHTTFF